MHLEMGFREDQPKLGPGKYGWIREERFKSLQPTTVPANVKLAPENILNLIKVLVFKFESMQKHQDVAVIMQNWHAAFLFVSGVARM